RRVAGALAIVACIVVAAAFGPRVLNSIRGLRGVPGDHSTVSAPVIDRLAGSWQATVTRAKLQAVANARFPLASTKLWDHFLQRLYQHTGHVTTTTVTFQDGQLSIDASRDGLPARSKWTGAYEVVSDNTFVAGDGGSFYITYHYTIDGNSLIVQVVDDRFPDDIGPSPPVIPDLLPQVLVWETAPFTKVG